VVKKRQKDISDIEQKIISMYAKGMTTRQISDTLEDIYGFEASEGFISDVTDKIIILATALALTFTACGDSSYANKKDDAKKTTESTEKTDSKDAPKEETEDTVKDNTAEVTCQSILDEYSQKIKDATPGLVEEYNTESAGKAGDINALAEISTAKIEKLAEISAEGTEKMAELMLTNKYSQPKRCFQKFFMKAYLK